MKVTFIGLGLMGSRMARHLLDAGVDLTVYNRTASALDALVQHGAKAADSAAAAVQQADVVLTMLATPEVVDTVSADFLPAMQPGSRWVDMSTINPSFAQQMQARAEAAGVRYLDAPVGGSLPQAEAAELIIFVGADPADFAAVEPLLQPMGKAVRHVGEVGKGSAFKILVNSLLAQAMVSFSETVVLGMKMGFDKTFLLDTLSQGAVAAPFLQYKSGRIKEDEYGAQFPLELMRKDLHLLLTTAYEQDVPQYMAANARELYTAALNKGMAREDFSAIFRYLEQR